jgi:hypothetical protein
MHQMVDGDCETDLIHEVADAHEFDIVCDFGGGHYGAVLYDRGQHDDPARWVLTKIHGCGENHKLLCTGCKDYILNNWSIGYMQCIHCKTIALYRTFFGTLSPMGRG